MFLVSLVVFFGVKFGFQKSCLCKINDKYKVWSFYLQGGDGEIVLPVGEVDRRQVDWENETDKKDSESNEERRKSGKIISFLLDAFPIPDDCEDGPEEPVNLRKRFGEDIADAVDGGHLGVLVQSLHQGDLFHHVVVDKLLSDNYSMEEVGVF